eukprot:768704-Hanusia_phi.AAC.1
MLRWSWARSWVCRCRDREASAVKELEEARERTRSDRLRGVSEEVEEGHKLRHPLCKTADAIAQVGKSFSAIADLARSASSPSLLIATSFSAI